jgi:hypothetical protein
VISLIFGFGFRRAAAWPGFFFLFLIIFLFSWAVGVWLVPFGPVIGEAYWLPFLVGAVFIAVIMAALAPPERRPRAAEPERAQAAETEAAFGIFFWLLVVLLLIAIAVYYM